MTIIEVYMTNGDVLSLTKASDFIVWLESTTASTTYHYGDDNEPELVILRQGISYVKCIMEESKEDEAVELDLEAYEKALTM